MFAVRARRIETYSFSTPIGWIVSQARNPAQSGFDSSQNMLPACSFAPHCTNKITTLSRVVILLNSAGEKNRTQITKYIISPSAHNLLSVRVPDSPLSFYAALRNSHEAPSFDSSRLATNSNDPNAYAFRSADLCGREESNSHLLVGSQSFYH